MKILSSRNLDYDVIEYTVDNSKISNWLKGENKNNMNLEFKISVESHQHEDLIPYTNALQRDAFLFEIFNNFPRHWKHADKEPTYQEIMDRIFELKQEYNVI